MNLNWKRSLNLGQDEVIGLDIGSYAVKVVRLRKDGSRYVVTAAGITRIKQAADNQGNEVNMARAIRECLHTAGVQNNLAVCSVSGPEVVVRDFSFPHLSEEEIEGAVTLEAGQICPFSTADSTIDYQLIPDDGGIRGVLVAATNSLVRRKMQLVKNASVECVLMDVDGLALLNCFSEYEQRKQKHTIAILNVGHSYTTLTILGDNGLPFIRDIGCAGEHIIKQIATETKQPVEMVYAVLTDASAAQEKLGDNLEKACERLIVDVNETLRYYAAQTKSNIAGKIFVCGGFALVNGFVDVLNRQLSRRAVLWNPFSVIPREADHTQDANKDLLQSCGPAMAVAAGLAVRSI